jgi:hypothetical protein
MVYQLIINSTKVISSRIKIIFRAYGQKENEGEQLTFESTAKIRSV